MPSSDTPNVNVIALASDDDIWVIETDIAGLRTVLENPTGFVRSQISISGQPGDLVEPFVIVFQEIEAKEGGPDVLIQGINHTALLTVKYSANLEVEDDGEPIHPVDEEHAILRHGNAAYSHLQLTGMSPVQVANSIIKSITSTENHFASLNSLRQTLNGEDVGPEGKHTFMPNTKQPTQFIYQGATEHPAAPKAPVPPTPPATPIPPATEPNPAVVEDPPPPPACSVNMGDCNNLNQVIVNNVIIKTYMS